jgi:hypothetical protein
MTRPDWITDEQLKIATNKAIKIFDDFCKDKNGEESLWTGIEIDDKSFDIECWDKTGADRGVYRCDSTGTLHCNVYPTREVDGQTETDGDNYITVLARICGITYKLQEINDEKL